jgi:hypothetical protein
VRIVRLTVGLTGLILVLIGFVLFQADRCCYDLLSKITIILVFIMMFSGVALATIGLRIGDEKRRK